MYGIDVAKWQGTIDWKKVKSAGKQFAILKVTQKDNSIEPAFEENYAGCELNDIKVGVYRYVYAKNVTAAMEEAEKIVKVLAGKNIRFGVWLDMEDGSIRGIGKAGLTEIIHAEAKIIQEAGYRVGIYCNKDWYENILDGKALSKLYPFWIARYPAADNGTVKESLSPKAYAKAWQYSSKGKVPGINGNVDLNISFIDLEQDINVGKESVKYYPKYTGNSISIISALQQLHIDSKYAHRKQIARANGIMNYRGTAPQNLEMLDLLKNGILRRE